MNVFVTGASSGIGAALAQHYAARGFNLGLFARNADRLEALQATLPAKRCAIYVGDVRDASALMEAAAAFRTRFGLPHIVIANAGVSVGTLTEHEVDNASFMTVLDTNVLGMLYTFQPFVPAMRQARRGTLVGIASVAGFRGVPGSGAYSASKAAAIAYLESLRVEMRDSGVSVVTICPGFIDTPLTQGNPYGMPFLLSPESAARRIAKAIEQRRRFYVVPWQMALFGRVLRVLPRPIYDRLFARAPRKLREIER